jgi:hypothetical protein
VEKHASAYGLSSWIAKSVEGVAAANRATAEELPFFPHSYELAPHCRRMRGTCIVNGASLEVSGLILAI